MCRLCDSGCRAQGVGFRRFKFRVGVCDGLEELRFDAVFRTKLSANSFWA